MSKGNYRRLFYRRERLQHPLFLPPRRGAARRGEARRGEARRGEARRGEARRGEARRGEARRGEARRGEARRGEARRGEARRSEARCGWLSTDSIPRSALDGGVMPVLLARPIRRTYTEDR
ncbi:hypothetical protein ALC56_08782 [Trachymyrmex septentrionalis]|uniref:Uncharacterized protein n=1 Tax=Trachymyrmex septentrionalis TaxID=34720 RepID=A0A195F9D6_9HYME|nr:hypothetical protein ALC56_08782 [Trachymyrmex septentrionalis]